MHGMFSQTIKLPISEHGIHMYLLAFITYWTSVCVTYFQTKICLEMSLT